jgi:hypothetical protein
MRQLASLLLIALALPAVAAQAWRWKDDKGVVHYSDTPVPGAERVDLPSPPQQGTVVTPAAAPAAAPPAEFRYTECVVLAPGNEQTFNNVTTITASVRIAPALLQDHRVQVVLDDEVYGAWPARMLTYKLENLYRGRHTLAVTVVDAGKKTLCAGPVTVFHVLQPSVLSPARAKPKP